MIKNCTVYGLCSSESGEVRYVGQTIQRLTNRLKFHLHSANHDTTPVARWMKREIDRGHEILIFALENNAILNESECRYIAWYREHGLHLLNLTEGGEGTVGHSGNKGIRRPDLACRNRLGKGKPGHPSTPEINAKISAAQKGRPRPYVSERNRANKGKPGHKHTDAHKAYISRIMTGRVFSSETIERMKEAARKRVTA